MRGRRLGLYLSLCGNLGTVGNTLPGHRVWVYADEEILVQRRSVYRLGLGIWVLTPEAGSACRVWLVRTKARMPTRLMFHVSKQVSKQTGQRQDREHTLDCESPIATDVCCTGRWLDGGCSGA